MFNLRESDKHFLWSLLGAIGIVLFWRGIWSGIDLLGELPRWIWVSHPSLSLFVGLAILTFSGMIFREFDPLGGIEKGVTDALNKVQTHPQKKEFSIIYYDNVRKKDIHVNADDIKNLEKSMLLIHEGGREVFIPLHRVKAIHRGEKIIWRM